MKRLEALIAATIITAIVALGMLAIGVNALFNPNSVQASNTLASGVDRTSEQAPRANNPSDQAQITELQNELAQTQDQLNQANAQLDQMQQLLQALQQRGLIRITSDGRILIPRGGLGGGFGGN